MENETAVYSTLIKCGILPPKKGFRYLYELISRSLDGENLYPLKTVGYVSIADKFDTNSENIDKAIQNAISFAFLRSHENELYNIFGNTVDEERGKVGNKQFICTICDYIKNMNQ